MTNILWYLPIIPILLGLIFIYKGIFYGAGDHEGHDLERGYGNMSLSAMIFAFISMVLFIILIYNPPND